MNDKNDLVHSFLFFAIFAVVFFFVSFAVIFFVLNQQCKICRTPVQLFPAFDFPPQMRDNDGTTRNIGQRENFK